MKDHLGNPVRYSASVLHLRPRHLQQEFCMSPTDVCIHIEIEYLSYQNTPLNTQIRLVLPQVVFATIAIHLGTVLVPQYS